MIIKYPFSKPIFSVISFSLSNICIVFTPAYIEHFVHVIYLFFSLPFRMLYTQVKMETTWPLAEMSASYIAHINIHKLVYYFI